MGTALVAAEKAGVAAGVDVIQELAGELGILGADHQFDAADVASLIVGHCRLNPETFERCSRHVRLAGGVERVDDHQFALQ